jgi:outer membrane lipoprotein SlyB
MTYRNQYLFAGAVACALSLPVLAQEYRYPGANEPPPQTAQQQPARQQPQAVPVTPLCTNCGTIDPIRVVEQAGQGSGVGMIAGGVLGGLLGHQIGHGSGNTAATIVGAAGGAYAGNHVEKNVKKVARYDVSVRMDDGTLRTVSYEAEPGFRSGDKVRFIDGRLTRN